MYFCIKMYFSQYKLNSEEEILPWCINMCRKRHWDFKSWIMLGCYNVTVGKMCSIVMNCKKILMVLKILYAKHSFPLILGWMWLMGWIWWAKCWFLWCFNLIAVNVEVVEVFWDACSDDASVFCGFSPARTRNNVVKISV